MKEIDCEAFDLMTTLREIYRAGGLVIATVPKTLMSEGARVHVISYRVIYVEARFR